MKNNQQPKFSISVSLKEAEERSIEVTPAETTDGVPYYKCDIDGDEIQLRENEEGEWELIWGDLDHKAVQAIGKKIKAHKD